jgi:aspartyl-tRNA(Asn)/glutamyl-tRNA(Gln) amidotransferase subunit A
MMAAVDSAAEKWRALGAKVVDVALPSKQRMDACIQTILLAEGFAIHGEWLRTRPQDYGRVTRERLMMGAFVTGGEYVQAQRLRRIITAEVDAVLAGCDAILCAGNPTAAPRVVDVDEGPFRRSPGLSTRPDIRAWPCLVVLVLPACRLGCN